MVMSAKGVETVARITVSTITSSRTVRTNAGLVRRVFRVRGMRAIIEQFAFG